MPSYLLPMFASLPCPHLPRVPLPSDLHWAVRAHQSRRMGTQVLVDLNLLQLVGLGFRIRTKPGHGNSSDTSHALQYASAYFARPIHLQSPG
jgi:hypothetical protein